MELMRGKPVADMVDSASGEILNRGNFRLAVYLLGGDRASKIYASSKVRKGRSLGAEVILREFREDVSLSAVMDSVMSDAENEDITGIMIERPLPDHIDIDELMVEVPPGKDVEGLHPENYGLMAMGRPRFVPPTPLGAILMLMHHEISTRGKRVMVIGRSQNVGRPVSILLSLKKHWANATVTQVHSATNNMEKLISSADIVVSAAGKKGLVKGDMLKDDAVLIDLGINPFQGGIVGDSDLDSMEGMNVRATPTPGGTGPVTTSCMFLNLALAGILKDNGKASFPGIISEIYG